MFSTAPSIALALAFHLLPAAQAAPDATTTNAAISPSSPPRYWKGNLHTHTFWSDGNDFPEMIVDWYDRAGYNFLAITDHNVMLQGIKFRSLAELDKKSRGKAFQKYLDRFGSSWVQTRGSREQGTLEVRLKPFDEYRSLFEERGRFILLPGEEVTMEAANKRAVHMNVTNLMELIAPAEGATVPELIEKTTKTAQEQATRLGREILVHVNHPNYKWGVMAEDLAAILSEPFFEIWNGVDGDGDPGQGPYPSTDEIWDIANTLRIAGSKAPPLLGLATDDSHDFHQDSTRAMPGRAWVMVRAGFLTPESIIHSIRAGDFYASSGVELESIVFDAPSGTYSLHIHPVAGEHFTTRFIGTRIGANLHGKPRHDADGAIVATSLDYTATGSPAIGEVFAEVPGIDPSYKLQGNELYVRAVVISDALPQFPTKESQNKKAWTQPVGWESRVTQPAK